MWWGTNLEVHSEALIIIIIGVVKRICGVGGRIRMQREMTQEFQGNGRTICRKFDKCLDYICVV